MHDLNFIRTEPETIKTAVRQRQAPELAATVDEAVSYTHLTLPTICSV